MSQKTTTPFSSEGDVFVELSLESLNQVIEGSLIFLSDTGEGNAGGVLKANQFTESCLTSDEAERNVLLSAELGKPDNSFDGVNIVGDDDESSFLVFDEASDVIQTVLKGNGGLGVSGGLVFSLKLSSFQSSFSSLFGGFGSVVSEELQESGGLVSVDGGLELVQCWGNLESLEEDSLLSLEDNVFGPSDESGQISDGLDITTNSEVSGFLFEEGVSLDLGGLGDLSLLSELFWGHFASLL